MPTKTLHRAHASRAPAGMLRGVKQDERAPFVRALERARVSAYPPGEFVEQESFMRAGEILTLARQAGIGPRASVLDLCCGIAGPGRFITRQLGCSYLGVDYSASAIDIARERAGELPCRFEVAHIPPVPPGPFDVVLLLETMLAFPDKAPLLKGISRALSTGGRFAFTLEAGVPLSDPERAACLTPTRSGSPRSGHDHLAGASRAGSPLAGGLQPRPSRHDGVADQRVCRRCTQIAGRVGPQALEELIAPTGSGATGSETDGSANRGGRREGSRRRRPAITPPVASRSESAVDDHPPVLLAPLR